MSFYEGATAYNLLVGANGCVYKLFLNLLGLLWYRCVMQFFLVTHKRTLLLEVYRLSHHERTQETICYFCGGRKRLR